MNKKILAVCIMSLYWLGCVAQEVPESDTSALQESDKKVQPVEQKTEVTQKEKTALHEQAKQQDAAQKDEEKTSESDTIKTGTEESEDLTGIDTVDLEEPQGNWFFKRIWWNRAQARYENIRSSIDKIFEARISFFTKRNTIDKQVLDPFYMKIGISQGEFIEILNSLITEMEREREEDGALDEKEKTFLATLEQEKQMVQQLKLDVQAVEKIDQEFDTVLSNVMGQINKVRSYEQEAWNKFKDIAGLLSDTQARDNYYQIDAIFRNVKDIETYVTKTLTTHIDELVATAKKQVDTITHSVDTFKQKGIDFKSAAETFEQEGRFTRLEDEFARREVRKKQVQEVEEEQEGTWGQTIYAYTVQPILTTVYYIGYGIAWPFMKVYGLFFGGNEEEEK